MRILRDIAYNNYQSCKLDMYLPDQNVFATIICFHGGGLEHGDKKDCARLAEDITNAGYAFVSAEYRMYKDDVKFPAFLCDAADAIAFVKANIEAYGGNKDKLYVSGQSAGAWMALMLCVNEEYLRNVGIDSKEICGWIIDSAQTTAHFNVLKYELGIDSRLQRINEFAPQYFISEKTAFSRMLLLFYENDMPCRYEQNMLFYRSILAFNPQADIAYKVLSGGHCNGSTVRDADGQYAYVKETLSWLND